VGGNAGRIKARGETGITFFPSDFSGTSVRAGLSAGAIALIAALTPLGAAHAQLPNGNTGLGDAQAKDLPTRSAFRARPVAAATALTKAAPGMTAPARIGAGIGLTDAAITIGGDGKSRQLPPAGFFEFRSLTLILRYPFMQLLFESLVRQIT
jgi:hypothetical protein